MWQNQSLSASLEHGFWFMGAVWLISMIPYCKGYDEDNLSLSHMGSGFGFKLSIRASNSEKREGGNNKIL